MPGWHVLCGGITGVFKFTLIWSKENKKGEGSAARKEKGTKSKERFLRIRGLCKEIQDKKTQKRAQRYLFR
jgi:hypothetical protein